MSTTEYRVVTVRAYDGELLSSYGERLSREWADKVAAYALARVIEADEPMVVVEVQERVVPPPPPTWATVAVLAPPDEVAT